MNLKQLSDAELNIQMLTLAKKERELLHEVILHLIEADRRQLYLGLGFSSLFEYMTSCLKYSAGSAQRRIDAARLSSSVPMVVEKIQTGDLTLAQASLVQKSLREYKKENHKTLSKEKKQELVSMVLNQSEKETQSLLAKTLDLPVIEATRITPQADGSFRLEVSLTQEQWRVFEKARELLSHSVPDGSFADVISHMSEKVIKHYEGKTKPKKAAPSTKLIRLSNSENTKQSVSVPDKSVASNNRKAIPASAKRMLFNKAQHQCQHVNAISKHKCTSRWQLEIDHKQPIWAGGTNEIENLQILCRKHNQRKYFEQAHIKKI